MLLVANWKQFLSPAQEINLTKELINYTATHPSPHQLCLLPSALSLKEIGELLADSGATIQVGAQDVANDLIPAQTGSLRADFIPAKTILIGHAERSRLNHETIEDVQQKIASALQANKQIILCFGEKEMTNNDKQLLVLLTEELMHYAMVINDRYASITLAYEPTWMIGSSETFSAHRLMQVITIANACGFAKVLYGGNINQRNIQSLLIPGLTGFLVGRASTKSEELIALLEALPHTE